MEAVLAGSGRFVALVVDGVRARAGVDPRVAIDPRQAFILCSGAGGLLVAEYGGSDWLPVVRDLRSLCGPEIAVVMAVPPEQAGEVARLQRAGADEVVAWDGRPEAVTWAVDRVLASRGVGAPQRQPPTAVPVLVTAPPDLGTSTSPPPLTRTPQGPPPPPPAGAFTIRELPAPGSDAPVAAAWPADVLDAAAAERLLAACSSGVPPGDGAAGAQAARLVASFTPLEQAAFAGEALPLETALLRRQAALRLRAATAAATAPAPGSSHDAVAVLSLLGEVDGVLAELKVAAEALGPEGLGFVQPLRDGLVKEAIGLTEAVSRLAPAGVAAEALAAGPVAARAPSARVLSNVSGEETRRRAPVGPLMVLAIAAVLGGGYHLHRYLTRPAPPSFGYPGAPEGVVAAPGGPGKPTVLVKQQGAFTPAEIERLRANEELKGRVVNQLAPGTLVIVAGPAPKEERKP